MKRFDEWKGLALILSEEISDDMYSPKEYKEDLGRNCAGSIPIWIPIACFIGTFPTLKSSSQLNDF